ncbi:MAG: glycosyltransferase family 4 protein [bacterium]|nr:glycosyltransferase family 4 protein [bacterium]
MRAAIFDPYLDTGGGGERYILAVAEVLKRNGWSVDLQWRDPKIRDWLSVRTGRDYSGINVVPSVSNGSGYDLIFWLSDGSVPLLFSKKNLIHFQTPFQEVGGKSLLNRIKFIKVNSVICNSEFTKSFIDKEFGVKSIVLYPPVSTEDFSPGKKENIILYVGRFSTLQQSKGQDILIECFKKLNAKDWKLVLAGGSEVGGKEFVQDLKKLAKGSNIEILENLPFSEIKSLYSKAKIFWSAAGYGVTEEETPEKVEHFGMTLVEGMAAGVVPLASNKGGHKEVIKNGENGYLWETEEELVKLTHKLINDERRLNSLAEKAKKDCEQFSEQRFEKELLEIIK